MKAFLQSVAAAPILVFIFIAKVIFPITAVITHLWTAYIGFTEGGFFGGVVTLALPVLSEFYWIYQMWNVNELYVWFALAHIILAFPAMLLTDRE